MRLTETHKYSHNVMDTEEDTDTSSSPDTDAIDTDIVRLTQADTMRDQQRQCARA